MRRMSGNDSSVGKTSSVSFDAPAFDVSFEKSGASLGSGWSCFEFSCIPVRPSDGPCSDQPPAPPTFSSSSASGGTLPPTWKINLTIFSASAVTSEAPLTFPLTWPANAAALVSFLTTARRRQTSGHLLSGVDRTQPASFHSCPKALFSQSSLWRR